MTHAKMLLAGLSLTLLLGSAAARASTPTFIESAADGKRLVEVDEKEISLPDTGHTLIYIDGNDLLTNIHDPAFLVVDDDDVRPTSAGVKIATFDGDNIRHGPYSDGKVMMNYHHPDLCPTAADDRLYHVNGPELTKQQLVAALYLLKPEMFKLTDAEVATQKKDMAEANAEEEKRAAADQVAGNWMVLNASGPVEKIGKGSIVYSPKKGDVYPVAFDYSKGGGPSWTGVASYKEVGGDKLVWTAFGTAKTIALCVYDIDGGNLTGTWYPWYVDGDPKNLGSETLKGPASLEGDFQIISAKAPTTGAPYSGTVSIKSAGIVGAGDDEKPYYLTWTLGTVKVYGIGVRTGNRLYVASGAGPDINIGKFKIDNGSFSGDFFKFGAKEMGSTSATLMN